MIQALNSPGPGANITGTSSAAAEVVGKQAELLKELLPRSLKVRAPFNHFYRDNKNTFCASADFELQSRYCSLKDDRVQPSQKSCLLGLFKLVRLMLIRFY
jgi:hypothetical protein